MPYNWTEFGTTAGLVFECCQTVSSLPLAEYKVRLEAIGGTTPEIVNTLTLVDALILVKTAFDAI